MNRATANLLHYSNHLLLDIYPLSVEAFRRKSTHQRASYDYLNQIVQTSHSALEDIMRALKVSGIPQGYAARVRRARELTILPEDLADAMFDFCKLRNETIHENPKIDHAVRLYPEILPLILCGFSLHELFWIFEERFEHRPLRSHHHLVIVDKAYLLLWLEPKSEKSAKPWDKYEAEYARKAKLARRRLLTADCRISFTASISQVAGLVG
ncbi:MAG: hypothetical protein ACRD2L_00875 [Terriglobia bacterium]